MVKPLGQSVKVPTLGTLKLGDKAPEVDLSHATVLTRSATKTTYDLNGDGFSDVEVTKRKSGAREVELVSIEQRDAKGALIRKGSFGYDVTDRSIYRLTSGDAKGNSMLIVDSDHNGKADFESATVANAHGSTATDRKLGADGKPAVTSTMVTTNSPITPGSVTLPTALDVQGFGSVVIGQDAKALDLTKGKLVSQDGLTSVYDRNGDGSQLVTITDVVDGKDQPIQHQVSVAYQDGTSAQLFVDAKRNAVSFVSSVRADFSQTDLLDSNNDGIVDAEDDATFVGNNMRWVTIDSTKGTNTPNEISTSISTEKP